MLPMNVKNSFLPYLYLFIYYYLFILFFTFGVRGGGSELGGVGRSIT
jgi:hypothetical protein